MPNLLTQVFLHSHLQCFYYAKWLKAPDTAFSKRKTENGKQLMWNGLPSQEEHYGRMW